MISIVRKLYPQVKHIVDAEAAVTVEVTDDDVRGAKVKDPANCAMARACKREYDLDGVVIAVTTAYLVKGNTAYRYSVPRSASRETIVFDRGGQFISGTYALTPFGPRSTLKGRLDRNKPTRVARKFVEHHHRTANIRNVYTVPST